MSIHELRARVAASFDQSIREGVVRLDGKPVPRDPATTPDSADEARWAAQRPARRIASRGMDL